MAKLEFNSAHLWTANPADGQPLDLSGYVSSIEATHDDDEAAGKQVWRDALAGLQSATLSLTFSEPVAEAVPVHVRIPSTATWRDRAKLHLHSFRLWRWYPFSWIPLRWVDYHFHADLWPTENGFAGQAVGPITKGLEER